MYMICFWVSMESVWLCWYLTSYYLCGWTCELLSQVQLTEYNPDRLDESVLWTESKDLGDGYRTVRMVNNIKLNVDAWNGDKNHGGVRDGTKIYLYEWKKDSNQRWTMVPYCKFMNTYFTYYIYLFIYLFIYFDHLHIFSTNEWFSEYWWTRVLENSYKSKCDV